MHCHESPHSKPELRDYNTTPTNIEKIPVHQITQTALASPGRLSRILRGKENVIVDALSTSHPSYSATRVIVHD